LQHRNKISLLKECWIIQAKPKYNVDSKALKTQAAISNFPQNILVEFGIQRFVLLSKDRKIQRLSADVRKFVGCIPKLVLNARLSLLKHLKSKQIVSH